MPRTKNAFVVHERLINDDASAVATIEAEIISGQFELPNPNWTTSFEPSRLSHGWYLWAEQGGKRLLLSSFNCSDPIAGPIGGGFMKWLKRFQPKTCIDWLAVPRLYSNLVCFGKVPLGIESFTQSKLIDYVLSPTRGLLHWDTQLRDFIRLAEITGTTGRDICKLISGYRIQNPAVRETFENVFVDGISLLQIFDQRSSRGAWLLGTPDLYVSSLLSERMVIDEN